MKKFLLFLSIIFLISTASAYFTPEHLYFSIKGMNEVNSPITQLCGDKLNLILDGNTAADVPVLHYYDEKVFSYISTHTRGSGYLECLAEAGTDTDSLCICYGVGLHTAQDSGSHNEGGVVEKYLRKSFGSNFGYHMIIERSYQDGHREYLENNKDPYLDELDYYNTIVLDSFFEQTGGAEKNVLLMNHVTGLDIRNDLNLFANGYKGKGFYDTVYNEKLKLPWWFFFISISMMIVGFGISLLIIIYGKTPWKWLYMFTPWLLIGILGFLILLSFYTNNTWEWINIALKVPASLGLLDVSESDIKSYDEKVQGLTNRFLTTGELETDDASGLTHVDRTGIEVKGALVEAEKGFKYFIVPILATTFTLFNALMFYLTFLKKRKR